MNKLPDQTYLQSRIDYNPETGEARWKCVDANFGANWQRFNKIHAGKELPSNPRIGGAQFPKARILYKMHHGTEAKHIKYVNGDVSDYSINNLMDVDKRQPNVRLENINQEYLKSRIDYNPETGEARWKRVDENFGTNWKLFNKLYSGQIVPSYTTLRGAHFSKARILYKLYHGTEAERIKFVNGDSSDYSINNLIDTSDVSAKLDAKLNATSTTPTKKSYKAIHPDVLTLLRYDHMSGDLIWKPRGNKSWDARYANTIAGGVTNAGYRQLSVTLDSTSYLYMCHRVAWYLYYQCDPGNFQIDHIDEDKSNNRITNLRLANYSFNIQQARVKNKQFARRQDTNKWQSNFNYRGNTIHLGTFDTQEEANIAYKQALEKYKPIYEFSATEQAQLDELYRAYPNVSVNLQQRCHELQVKAINAYTQA